MTHQELNQYILHYLTEDKTKSAIMLTAPWGTGKSYYIQNELKPFLEKDENGKHQCIVISLYGLKNLFEVSKTLFIECRSKFLNSDSEKAVAGKFAAKTVINGVTSFFGIDLSKSAEDMEELYKSVDLSGKLIILEDLERSGIDILEVLGYVNNLVEQDGVKVLLVANEREILTTKTITDKDGKRTSQIVYTETTEKYLQTKEKTVSDTVIFMCDRIAAISCILKQFKDTCINDCIKNNGNQLFEEINDLMIQIGEFNFRSLIFACQKTVNIFSCYEKEINNEYFKKVFLSVIAFSLRLKQNDKLEWTKTTTAGMLGTGKYPLYRFCYDYIRYHEFDVAEIKKNEEHFLEQKEIEEKNKDMRETLNILYSFNTSSQKKLEFALKDILDKLCEINSIPQTEFGKLANYLIVSRCLVDCPEIIDNCKKAMITALSKGEYNAARVTDRIEIHDSFGFWTDEQKIEYDSFVKKMREAIDSVKKKPFNLEYSLDTFNLLVDRLYENKDKYLKQHAFMSKIDIDSLVGLLRSATSQQISELRSLILSVYSSSNIIDFYADDKEALVKLKSGIEDILASRKVKDKIIILQLTWMNENLSSIIDKLQ